MNTILLIDDDAIILSTFGLALRSSGYRVFEAKTGFEGFEIAQQQLPDLIITDIAMPDGDGEALLHHIRQHPDLNHTQVVLMTGQADHITSRRGMEAGADDFLAKPVSLQALLNCVKARLKRAQLNWRVQDQMLAQLRSSLHSNLPHEFFTPLGGILGLTDILRSDLANMSPSEANEILGDIRHSALRLHRSLRNYLRILELRTPPDPEKLPAPLSTHEVEKSIWSGVRESVRRRSRDGDVTVTIDPCEIMASATDLSLIVEELADNACRYSRQGTPITINFDAEGVLTVTDAGRGISPEELRQIRAFHQFDRTKIEHEGLGLGLILVQKLSTRCGTKPVIESTSGGTSIQIAFVKSIRVPRLETVPAA
jgi:two-component system, sensor histidine kinase and response regulator